MGHAPAQNAFSRFAKERRNQLSVDVSFPKRIIFVPDHDPIPRLPDGGLDWAGVTAIRITGVEDTHG